MQRFFLFTMLMSCAAASCASQRQLATPQSAEEADASVTDPYEAAAKQQGLELKKFDLNRDHNPDVYKFYIVIDNPKKPGEKIERLARKEVDFNYDGKVDLIRSYDEAEQIAEERMDLDFDGNFDLLNIYQGGAIIRKELDLNYDGKADIVKFYDHNQLARVESDRNLDGQPEVWEYYENGVLNRVGYDTNGDGQVDVWDRLVEKVAAPEAVPASPETKPGDNPTPPAAAVPEQAPKSQETNAVKPSKPAA